MQCYIGIDAGKAGGVAIIDPTGLTTAKMPTFLELVGMLTTVKKNRPECFIVLERVGFYKTDSANGKTFGIEKMVKNFAFCENAASMAGIPVLLVAAMSWQAGLKLRKKGDTKTMRKNRFKLFAQSLYPDHKITLATSDAVCLAYYGYKLATEKPDYLHANLSKP